MIQYREIKEEVKDLRRRIEKIKKFLDHPPVVADTVTGSRSDLTIGPIKVKGIPDPEYGRKKLHLRRYKMQLEEKEMELLKLLNEVEQFIDGIENSELRIMFRLYYIDDLTWVQTAHKMNQIFPNRNNKYTEDSCRMKNSRFFEAMQKTEA